MVQFMLKLEFQCYFGWSVGLLSNDTGSYFVEVCVFLYYVLTGSRPPFLDCITSAVVGLIFDV